ncbi:MAG: hypothetical protein IT538_15760 [Variibacter sp.]|nr:hypothetical protein [Variibacter sp.]
MPDYPFTTDGCSGGMTAAWRLLLRRDPPWNGCCVDHDRLYWPGGTAAERRSADAKLRACVAARGHPVWAWAMWAAVRLGGHPLLPFSWRWGYGWKYPRPYGSAAPRIDSRDRAG